MAQERFIKLVKCLENIESRGEQIHASLDIDPIVLCVTYPIHDRLIQLASEGLPEGVKGICSGIEDQSEPTLFVGHVIEHRALIRAYTSAFEQGHQHLSAEGKTTPFPNSVDISLAMSSNKGRGFNLSEHLQNGIEEVENLLQTSVEMIRREL